MSGAKIIAPGDAAKSTLQLRMAAKATEEPFMPAIGVSVPHGAGIKLDKDWIAGLKGCP